METVFFYETLASTNEPTRHQNPEEKHNFFCEPNLNLFLYSVSDENDQQLARDTLHPKNVSCRH